MRDARVKRESEASSSLGNTSKRPRLATSDSETVVEDGVTDLVVEEGVPETKEAQSHIVNNTFEYPMIDGVEPHDLVKQMGLGYNQDLKTKVVNYGKNQATALECMLAANWK
jgi:hypothetical protein